MLPELVYSFHICLYGRLPIVLINDSVYVFVLTNLKFCTTI